MVEPIFYLPLYFVFCFFGVGTSSRETIGEVVHPSSKVGVDEPLSATSFSLSFSLLVILSVFWPVLERGSFFFALILASLLNLLVIFAPKWKKNLRIQMTKNEKWMIVRVKTTHISSALG